MSNLSEGEFYEIQCSSCNYIDDSIEDESEAESMEGEPCPECGEGLICRVVQG